MHKLTSTGFWALMALLSLGIAGYGYTYLVPGHVGPLQVMHNAMARPWLYVHAGLAATALLIGPTQFLPALRRRWPRVHRWLGRIYAPCCLLGGGAGLAIAMGSTAGPIASLGFGLLAVSWIFCTAQAWRMAWTRQFDRHRRWMVRSFALTLAAVTLRLYLVPVQALGVDFLPAYRAISFLCWVPNLALAELYLNWSRLRPRTAAAAA